MSIPEYQIYIHSLSGLILDCKRYFIDSYYLMQHIWCICICTYICMCVYACVYIMYVCMYVYMHVFIYVYVCIYTQL